MDSNGLDKRAAMGLSSPHHGEGALHSPGRGVPPLTSMPLTSMPLVSVGVIQSVPGMLTSQYSPSIKVSHSYMPTGTKFRNGRPKNTNFNIKIRKYDKSELRHTNTSNHLRTGKLGIYWARLTPNGSDLGLLKIFCLYIVALWAKIYWKLILISTEIDPNLTQIWT